MAASDVVGDVLIGLLFIPSVAMVYGGWKLRQRLARQRDEERARRRADP